MRTVSALPADTLARLPAIDEAAVDRLLAQELAANRQKLVVLDDDPTGVQTVHGVFVYTDWSPQTLTEAFRAQDRAFFVLTNSRAMTAAQSEASHRDAARAIALAARETGRDFLLISRGDSTLRGHYPLETETLRRTLEAEGCPAFDGEIVYPFFKEGGRFTLGGVHYVREGEMLLPAGETEFARDQSFAYRASDLAEWCEEKTGGAVRAKDVTRIPIELLRAQDYDAITAKLTAVRDFGKVVVDGADTADVKVFAVAFLRAVRAGKRFLFRSAAAVPKVLGGVPDRPLLNRAELVPDNNPNGGVVLIGSHVQKTTEQMEALRAAALPLDFIEFDQHRVLEEGGLERERARVVALAEKAIAAGRSVVIYTRRDRFDLPNADADAQLQISTQISDAVTGVIADLAVRPRFLVAKGGITSSDVGTKALRVRRALVLGQIAPGVPVWRTGAESKFPNLPYVIFPGNVGERDTLLSAVEVLMEN